MLSIIGLEGKKKKKQMANSFPKVQLSVKPS